MLFGLVLSALAATTACSGQSPSSAPHRAGAGAASSEASADLKRLNAAWADFREVADRLPGRPLTLPRMSATRSFAVEDVGVLARTARRITLQSIDPRLSAMSPDAAFRSAMGGTYPATRDDARVRLESATGDASWQRLAASRFPRSAKLGRPQVIDARWKWGESSGTTDDGTRSPVLWVGVQTFTRTPVTVGGQTYPVVVRRTVNLSSFRPRGGPAWWPAVTFDSWPYGNDGCYLSPGTTLVPTRRVDGLGGDLKDLRSWLSPTALAAGSKVRDNIVWPDYEKLKKQRASHPPAELRKMEAKSRTYCATPTP